MSGFAVWRERGLVDTSIPGRHPSLFPLLAVGIVGAAVPLVLFQFAGSWGLGPVSHGRDTIVAGVGLSAILLIPASIFAPTVGAMFPDFDQSTPVTLIDDGAFRWLLRLAVFGLSFGGSVVAFDLSVTSLMIVAFGVVVGAALVLAIWLVQHSLSILDPDSLSAFLVDRATLHPLLFALRRPDPNQPFRDLCRLVRGYLNGHRPSAAAHGIDRMTEVWRVQGKRINKDARALAARVLGEARGRDHWRDYLDGPIERFVSMSGIAPNAESEAIARRRVAYEEPWLIKRPDDKPWWVRTVIQLIEERFGPI